MALFSYMACNIICITHTHTDHPTPPPRTARSLYTAAAVVADDPGVCACVYSADTQKVTERETDGQSERERRKKLVVKGGCCCCWWRCRQASVVGGRNVLAHRVTDKTKWFGYHTRRQMVREKSRHICIIPI